MFLSIILIFLHVQVAFWQLLINEHDDDNRTSDVNIDFVQQLVIEFENLIADIG